MREPYDILLLAAAVLLGLVGCKPEEVPPSPPEVQPAPEEPAAPLPDPEPETPLPPTPFLPPPSTDTAEPPEEEPEVVPPPPESPKAPAPAVIVHAAPPPPLIVRGVTSKPSLWVQRYKSIRLRASWSRRIIAVADRIEADLPRYETIEEETGVPWFVVACLHNMEASGRFDKHLHNGNPLTRRTYWVPKGRIPGVDPPYSWEQSAKDALEYDGLTEVSGWDDLHHLLYTLERFNGLGYAKYHKDVPSPYLWSGSFHYTRGKYVSDGRWSSTAVSQQVGAAAILRELEIRRLIQIE